ncbi:TonB-dependent receptor [Phenylobacterium sp.]|jgi:hypothetical protein|uniref:TonB-dependent receptor n=1 Tax=Phenylobacterium sp. TaxID=1871053 RepID=UPI002E374323|nr:TonB-dependent receptor [Phenylobacterium sp.]HEX2560186.1 TonB-dependent receptor [Phenylobacterium sp.]
MRGAFLLLGLAAFAPAIAHADPDGAHATAGEVEPVYVWGKRQNGVGTATSASAGEVAFAAFADRPLLRPPEVLEVIPGLAATQHSGAGKANQYFLRGFNLDHGTDFSVSFDGAPINLRSNAHGQGYLDLNFLTPELVETVSYRKGPYFATVGDFSAAGSADLSTFDALPQSFASATFGEHDYARLLAAVNLGAGYLAADVTGNDGPWNRPEELRRASLVLRQRLGDWRFTGLAYASDWNATDQIPQRALDQGLLDRFGALDPTDGGRSRRLLLAARRDAADGLGASVYAQYYRLNLWSNFTYFLNDPDHGDQFEQAEERWIAGGAMSKSWLDAGPWSYAAGVEARYDHIPSIGLYRTRARERLSTDRQDGVDQGSAAAWGEAAWQDGPFRATFGVRLDGMVVGVASDDPRNSGHEADLIVSPKLALSWRAAPELEFYANAGRGFHSNDARGATARISPDGSTPLEPVRLLVPATGGELGVRWERTGLSASLALWALKLDSELVYTGDAGDTESTDASGRIGVEGLVNWSPSPRLNLEASAALTHARYLDAPGADRIPNALEYVVTGGATWQFTDRLTGGLTVRHLGPAPLVEDDSARAPSSTVANLLVRYRAGDFELTGELLNAFDSSDADISYFYASRLQDESLEGVEDVHLHPIEPRTIRLGVRRYF